MLADVDRPVLGGDGRDDDVKTLATRQLGVDEGTGQIQTAPGGSQHPFDQNREILTLQDRGSQLRTPGTGDEDASGVVDPDLLNGLVIEVSLKRTQAGYGVEYVGAGSCRVDERWNNSGIGTAQVVVLGLGDELFEGGDVRERVDPASANQLTNLRQEEIGGVHIASQRASV